MNKPKISVIISTFNRVDKLKRAIKSVLKQEFTDFELIIVDDCSTDKTRKFLKTLKDERIKIILRDKNYGHDGRPKNEAIKIATGGYIAFLDDDDEYYPEALKILHTYAIHTDADVIYGDYMNEEKGVKVPGWSIHFDANLLSRQNYIAMCVVIIKKEKLFEVGGFNENIPKFKDWNLWIRLQKNGCNFAHIPIIITKVHQSKDTISNRVKNETTEDGHILPTYFSPPNCKIYSDKTVLGEAKKPKVAIFTLTLDRLEYTKQMYKSLIKTAGYDFDWYVIDQGSTDGTVEWLEGKCNLTALNKNIGIAKGWDMAISKVKKKCDIVVKVDNDCELMTKDWLKDMVELFQINKKLILSPYIEGLEASPGGVLRQTNSDASPYITINDRVLGVVPNLGGIVFASSIDLYQDFKFPDEIPGNKDYYLSRYAQQAGYALAYMEEYRAWHIKGEKGQKEDYPEYFKKLYNK